MMTLLNPSLQMLQLGQIARPSFDFEMLRMLTDWILDRPGLAAAELLRNGGLLCVTIQSTCNVGVEESSIADDGGGEHSEDGGQSELR